MPSKKTAERRRAWRLRSGSAPDPKASAVARRHWTPEEEARIFARDKPDRELAAELGRSINAIQTRRYQIGGRSS